MFSQSNKNNTENLSKNNEDANKYKNIKNNLFEGIKIDVKNNIDDI